MLSAMCAAMTGALFSIALSTTHQVEGAPPRMLVIFPWSVDAAQTVLASGAPLVASGALPNMALTSTLTQTQISRLKQFGALIVVKGAFGGGCADSTVYG